GITGVSLFGNYINNLNPATMTKIKSTLISLQANYGFLKSTNEISENKVSNGNVLGINIGIPFDQKKGLVFSLGFNPASQVNYKIRLLGTAGSQNYAQTYSGKGGLSRINAGMSYNLLKKVSIGLEYNYAFGEIREQNFIDFNNQTFTNTNIQKEFDFQRSFVKGGIVFELGKIFNSKSINDLSIGLVYQSGFNLTATEDGIFSTSINSDTIRLNEGQIFIPDFYGAGITNIFNKKYAVSGDILLQDWSKHKVFGRSDSNFQQSFRAGLGIEILPTPGKNSFWQILTYRLGGFYEKGFFKIAGQDVNSYGVRGGVNIPISNYNSLDFGINYSIRGKTGNGLIKDEFLNLTLGINFGELWFLRPREEDQ
ncbi:MAG: hypothetical protein M3P82_06335, partial [Bacteroidota bacterium]|nr:hypothetical protein [Bacteroidota bacterium]